MVQDWISCNAGAMNDRFQSRRRRPSVSSALLDTISRSTDTNTSQKAHGSRRKSRDSTVVNPYVEKQLFSESPSLNTSTWLYYSLEPEMTHIRTSLRRSADDVRMKEEPFLPSKKVKPVSPGRKFVSFINSLFTPSFNKRKSQRPNHGYEKEKASMSSRSASNPSTPSCMRVSDVYKRYDPSVAASLYTKPKPLDVNNGLENARDKPCFHDKYSFLHREVLYEAEEEEEEEVASDFSSDLFELENMDMDIDFDLPVFGTTHLDTSKVIAKGLLR